MAISVPQDADLRIGESWGKIGNNSAVHAIHQSVGQFVLLLIWNDVLRMRCDMRSINAHSCVL
jgi:hypothetical protein